MSSKDHIPRIAREWAKRQDSVDASVTTYASTELYAESEIHPFILEGPFEEFINAFRNVFNVPEDSFEGVANEVSAVFQRYKP